MDILPQAHPGITNGYADLPRNFFVRHDLSSNEEHDLFAAQVIVWVV